MITTLVEQSLALGRPVYLAQDVDSGINPAAAQRGHVVAPTLQRVPQGLSFRLYADQEEHADPAPDLNLRGLIGDSLSAQEGLTQAVRQRYTPMLTNRGVYLAQRNLHEEAIAAFQQAVLVDAEFCPAYQEWGSSLEALGRQGEAEGVYDKARAMGCPLQSQAPGP
jgi:tetratricopeptide (TPR) repeat protein